MLFLETENGDLIGALHIVRIGPLNSRPQFKRWWHEIDYVHGGEPRSTTASARVVSVFLSAEEES